MKTCNIKTCENKHHARGRCKTHYHDLIEQTKLCSVSDCNSLVVARGWCSKHYTRWKRHGDPLASTKKNRGRGVKLPNPVEMNQLELDTYEYSSRVTWGIAAKTYYGDKCSICGWAETTCDADHIIPVKDGGKNTISNCQILCPNHHAIKTRG